jgi:hypothetical protein
MKEKPSKAGITGGNRAATRPDKDIPPGEKLATCFRRFLQALAVGGQVLVDADWGL